MSIIKSLKIVIYNRLRSRRCDIVKAQLDPDAKTILDIGCQEFFFRDQLKDKYQVTLADFEPRFPEIKQEDVQNLSFEDNAFDIVLCQQVLEHVPDPVKAMGELKRVAAKQLIITVPHEPTFTLARLGHWEKEHLWAVTDQALECHLGKPDVSKNIVFGRYYMGVWNL